MIKSTGFRNFGFSTIGSRRLHVHRTEFDYPSENGQVYGYIDPYGAFFTDDDTYFQPWPEDYREDKELGRGSNPRMEPFCVIR